MNIDLRINLSSILRLLTPSLGSVFKGLEFKIRPVSMGDLSVCDWGNLIWVYLMVWGEVMLWDLSL